MRPRSPRPTRARHRTSREMIAALEPRRLLSLDINGTAGDDEFLIEVEGDTIRLEFNGSIQVLNAPSDGRVFVNAFEGNDTIRLRRTGGLESITLAGFQGDDTYRIGAGDLQEDVRCRVTVAEWLIPGEGGNDQVVIDDSVDDGILYRVSESAFEFQGIRSGRIEYVLTSEDAVHVEGSTNDDILEINSLRPNMSFDLGAGADRIEFGGPDGLFDAALPAGVTIEPGAGLDRLVINDSNPASTRSHIDVEQIDTPVGQPLRWRLLDAVTLTSAVFDAFVRTHNLPGGGAEPVVFTGTTAPAADLTVIGVQNGPDLVQLGTPGNPLPNAALFFNHMTLRLGSGVGDDVEIHQNQLRSANSAWRLEDAGLAVSGSPAGSTFLSSPDSGVDVYLGGTGGPDTLNVVDVPDHWQVEFEGRGGDDLVQQTGPYDLDDVFDNLSFTFSGGPDFDTLVLNDGDDQTGDADEYQVTDEQLMKTVAGDFGEYLSTLVDYSFLEHVALVADADPNVIHYNGASFLDVLEIYGGPGNDVITNVAALGYPPDFKDLINNLPALADFHGGDGADVLEINDIPGSPGDFDLSNGEIAYTAAAFNGPRTDRILYDSFSTLALDASNQANTIRVHSKPIGMSWSVFGRGGNDTFVVGGGRIEGNGFVNTDPFTLLGGDGVDTIEFDDRNDDHFANEPEVYSLTFQEFRKDAVRIAYGSFESQRLTVGGPNPSPLPFDNVVNVNGIDVPTTITGVPGRGNVVNVNWNQVFAALTLDLGNDDANTVNVNDQASAANNHYRFTAAGLTAGFRALNYAGAGVDRLNLFAGGGNDFVDVAGSPPGTSVYAAGNGGNDSLWVGDGRVADVRGTVALDGGPGTDDVRLNNQNVTAFADVTVTANSFSADGGPSYFYAGAEYFVVIHGAGGSRTDVRSAPGGVQLSVTGGPDNDVFVVGGGDLDANIPSDAALLFDGFGGADRIEYDDRLDVNEHGGTDSYVLDADLIPFLGSFLRYDRLAKRAGDGPQSTVESWRVAQRVLHASDADTPVYVTDAGTGLRVNANGGNDEVYVYATPAGIPVAIDTGAGADLLDVNADAGAPATVLVDRSDGVSSLYVRPGGTLRVGPGAVLTREALPAPGGFLLDGVLDLAGGALILQQAAGQLAGLTALAKGGYNGNGWDGTNSTGAGALGGGAINSSLAAGSARRDAVGLAPASAVFGAAGGQFLGTAVGANDVLFRYTVAGDVDLDGRVTAVDLLRTRLAIGKPNARWDQGNINFDLLTTNYDYALIRQNLGQRV